ncbi:MAG TPA: threonine ammonia-lyase, biosynthetic, partial [Gammaproteobacteria bacterium]|nr:threonine ammonia-lyase, biosynthetic [Gammaproteobacteria bacterium]
MSIRTIKKILQARVYDVAEETPVDRARSLSRRLNNSVLLKREDLQPVFSFKIRGAYNRIVNLGDVKGVVACSAGNHAQGVAKSCSILNLPAVIVMPLATPRIKVDAVG